MKHIFVNLHCVGFLVNTTVLSQTILFQENFNYTPGQLTTVSGGNWVNFSGTGFFYSGFCFLIYRMQDIISQVQMMVK